MAIWFRPSPCMPTYIVSRNFRVELQRIKSFALSDKPDVDWR